VLFKEREVVGDTDERPAVTGQGHNGAGTKDGVDSAALQAEVAKI
jgi:hypothetical protein